jgi:endonuclease/exonuclease/phosphatase family metal-dependent hydrolase
VAGTVRISGRRVRVYAVHLGTLIDIGPSGQEDQARAILRDADTSSIPVIIAGDLNSVQAGKVFEHGGYAWPTKGLGHTYALFDFDHIFVRGLPVPASFTAGIVRDSLNVSDHRPVWAVVALGAPVVDLPITAVGGSE